MMQATAEDATAEVEAEAVDDEDSGLSFQASYSRLVCGGNLRRFPVEHLPEGGLLLRETLINLCAHYGSSDRFLAAVGAAGFSDSDSALLSSFFSSLV